jgi:predicted O-linked N-acetylglucosamine transferase (SPINDLY family)
MGVDYIDYIIADRTVIPARHEPFYSERVAYLPDTYQANDAKRRISESVPERRAAGLPESGFVFCCFNNNFKIMPEMFAIWMRMLGAIEGSVLWLLEDNAAASRNLKREAGAQGIDPERLIFARRTNLDAHLTRHRRADLFLDTLPYNAHTSASDALWAGSPSLLSMAKLCRPGRGELAHAVGLPELITESLEDYEGLAVRLAGTRRAVRAQGKAHPQPRDHFSSSTPNGSRATSKPATWPWNAIGCRSAFRRSALDIGQYQQPSLTACLGLITSALSSP